MVGRKGTKIPTIPRNKETIPKNANEYLTNFIEGCLTGLFTNYLFSLNPILLCVPSQNGSDDECPHRQSATLFALAIFVP